MTDGEDDYSYVYLGVHALACRSGIPILSTSVNQPWLHFEPPPDQPMRTQSIDESAKPILWWLHILATLRWTLQRVACVVSSLALQKHLRAPLPHP